jgi:hypothetical protein
MLSLSSSKLSSRIIIRAEEGRDEEDHLELLQGGEEGASIVW